MTKTPEYTPPSRRFARIASVIALVVFFTLLLLFDQIKSWVGRNYYEQRMPSTITREAVAASFGEPDMQCPGKADCNDFLAAFVFTQPPPAHTSFFAYTNHFPLLPVLVFFQNESGAVVKYAYSRN